MKTLQLQVSFLLHGCRSLKDKRRRLSKLRDKFGRQTAMAVCESDFQDDWRRSHWTFVACGTDAKILERMLSEVESYVALSVDAEVVGVERSWLV